VNTYHHVCLIVDDVDAAIAEVGSGLGITFHPPRTADFGGATFPVTYSVEGPPFVELTERTDGILLDTNGLHHIGIYDETPTETRARVEAAGFELEVDGEDGYKPSLPLLPRSPERPPH